jgi:CheY-like chemotaxis protein
MARPKILLIDDDPDFLKITAEFLESKGYEVVTATDPERGMVLLKQDSFAVAFLDINFDESDDHDKSGLALAIETIGTSSVPKVILTVHGSVDYTREALRPRWGKGGAAVDFLHKEDGLQQMVDSIEQIVRRARIFLSYTKPNREAVKELYGRLQMSGYLPWMDVFDIVGGEAWETAVRSAIRKTDFVVVCLSRDSVGRQSFYHTEIGIALKILDEQPPGKIFLIPTRLDDCEVPYEKLQALNWIDLFEEDGYERITRALNEGIDRWGRGK